MFPPALPLFRSVRRCRHAREGGGEKSKKKRGEEERKTTPSSVNPLRLTSNGLLDLRKKEKKEGLQKKKKSREGGSPR